MDSNRGKIVTFYSHKGGTGRSMALANVACILSRRADVGRGVLVIDWDLEAPGLHWFFRNAGLAGATGGPSPSAQKGVIDLFEHLNSQTQVTSTEPLPEAFVEQIVRNITLNDFVVKTSVPKVDLMLAGRFDVEYGDRVNGFEWRQLFERAPSLIRLVAGFLAERYDHILVDSRTGLNDTSGICTALLPDQLVLVFTPNRQSLIGGVDAVARAARYRVQSEDLRPLMVFPLPSRIDVSEPDLLEKWRFGDPSHEEDDQGYQGRFERLFAEIYGLPSCDLKNYFDEVQIQHVPRYSYGEEIAALRERGTRLSISRSYATLADVLARQESPWTLPPSTQGGAELVSDAAPAFVKIQAVKEYLPEERFKLKLHDLVASEVRDILKKTPRFDFHEIPNSDTMAARLHAYEAIANDLILIQGLLGYWGEGSHRSLLGLGAKRICDQILPQSGLTLWLAYRWYPALLLLYSGGITAVAAGRYENLRDLMLVRVPHPFDGVSAESILIHSVADAMRDMDRLRAFNTLPGLERRYTPRSEYLFTFFQPIFDDLLLLGSEYEAAFDRFELLYALEHGHRYENQLGTLSEAARFWGPVGRFGWKMAYREDPIKAIIAEADAEGPSWPPVQAGLFGGSLSRFKEVAAGYRKMLEEIRWS